MEREEDGRGEQGGGEKREGERGRGGGGRGWNEMKEGETMRSRDQFSYLTSAEYPVGVIPKLPISWSSSMA